MPKPRKTYASLQEKTFENALINLFQTEFGFLGGPSVIKLIVDRIVNLVEIYYPRMEHLHFGQLLWFAVSKDEKKGPGKGMKHLKMVPVIIDLVTPSDIKDLIKGVKQRKIIKKVMARIFKQSYKRGGPLAEHDVAAILHRDLHYISKTFREYQRETGEILPSRGVIHDVGGTMTHKAIIVGEYLEGKETPTICKKVDHSIDAADRYIKHVNQVRAALRNNVPTEEIPQVTGLSKRLAETYLRLLEKIEMEGSHNG